MGGEWLFIAFLQVHLGLQACPPTGPYAGRGCRDFSSPRPSSRRVVDQPGPGPPCWCIWSRGTVCSPGSSGLWLLQVLRHPSGALRKSPGASGLLGPSRCSGLREPPGSLRSPSGSLRSPSCSLRSPSGNLRKPSGSLRSGGRRAFVRSRGPLCRPYDKPLAVEVLLRHG